MSEAESQDRRIGAFLVEQGLATPAQVQECLEALERLRASGASPLPKLSELLRQKGYLTPQSDEKTLKRAEAAPGGAEAPDLPEEVRFALRDPANDLGKFVRLSLLGKGGMGEVWRGWDRELRRAVAIKFLASGSGQEEAELLREARVVAGLGHPNIAPVYEAGIREGRPYIVMQLIEGTTIRAARLGLRATLEAVRDAALALDFAHRRGVIHRDVKPENLMVAGTRTYVMDFGLARQTQVSGELSRSGAIRGTLQYMSPEQARGQSRLLDGRTDVYGLGATLYALLTRRPPHDAAEVVELLRRIDADDPARPRALDPAIPVDVETILLKAMEKDRDRRYATAMDLAEDIHRYLDGEPIRARPASFVYKLRKKIAKRKAVMVALGFGVAGILAVGGVLLARQRGREAELKEIGSLWAEVVLQKQGLHVAANDPARVMQKIREAVERVGDYLRRHSGAPQGWYVRARGWLYLDELGKAEADLEEALGREPDFSPGHVLLARVKLEKHTRGVYFDRGGGSEPFERARWNLEEARRCLDRGWKAGDERASVQAWGLIKTPEDRVTEVLTRALAAAYLDGDRDKAHRLLTEANDEEGAAEFCNWLGVLTSTPQEALRWHTRSLEHMPHSVKSLIDRAVARVDLDDLDGAAEDLTRALAINPRSALACHNRACVRLDQGKFQDALEDCSRALELDSNRADTLTTRGFVHYRRGEFEEAVRDYDRALQIDPRQSKPHARRGLARAARGDVAGARQDFTTALDVDRERGLQQLRTMAEEHEEVLRKASPGEARDRVESVLRLLQDALRKAGER